MKAIVVDDEPLARMRMSRLLSELGISVVAEGENGQDAIELVTSQSADVLFIDINMPLKSGLAAVLELGEMSEDLPAIIFCTAHQEHAFDAFKTDAIDYLLKPIQKLDIQKAIEKASKLTRVQLELLRESQQSENVLTIHIDGRMKKISIDAFMYFRSVDKNVFASRASGKEILVDHTLKKLEETFEENLIRIHRGTLINKKYIESLGKDEHGVTSVQLKYSGVVLGVSRRHLAEVKKCFD